MWDRGNHGDSRCRAHAADVGEDDVTDDEDFCDKADIAWAWIRLCFLGVRERVVAYATMLVG